MLHTGIITIEHNGVETTPKLEAAGQSILHLKITVVSTEGKTIFNQGEVIIYDTDNSGSYKNAIQAVAKNVRDKAEFLNNDIYNVQFSGL